MGKFCKIIDKFSSNVNSFPYCWSGLPIYENFVFQKMTCLTWIFFLLDQSVTTFTSKLVFYVKTREIYASIFLIHKFKNKLDLNFLIIVFLEHPLSVCLTLSFNRILCKVIQIWQNNHLTWICRLLYFLLTFHSHKRFSHEYCLLKMWLFIYPCFAESGSAVCI